MRTRLTFLDFAVGTAFATIPLTLDYEGTASCRAILFPLPLMTFERATERLNDAAQAPLISVGR